MRAKMLACEARAKRDTVYEGMTGADLAKVGRAAYGKFWQGQLAADLRMSRQGVIRWAQGIHRISLDKEIVILSICLRRVRSSHAYVRWMLRRVLTYQRALLQQEQAPRYKPLAPQGSAGRFFEKNAETYNSCILVFDSIRWTQFLKRIEIEFPAFLPRTASYTPR
jgi:hypothetical protein